MAMSIAGPIRSMSYGVPADDIRGTPNLNVWTLDTSVDLIDRIVINRYSSNGSIVLLMNVFSVQCEFRSVFLQNKSRCTKLKLNLENAVFYVLQNLIYFPLILFPGYMTVNKRHYLSIKQIVA